MELTLKGAVAAVSAAVKQIVAILTWSAAADFDLAAAYLNKDGKTWGLVYFNNKGDLNAYPFMGLSGDAGVGATAGANKEVLTIADLKDKKRIHILAWDYESIRKGQAALFSKSDVKLVLTDDQGKSYDVPLATAAGDLGNIACVATININPTGAQVVNTSIGGTVKEFKSLEMLLGALNLPLV